MIFRVIKIFNAGFILNNILGSLTPNQYGSHKNGFIYSIFLLTVGFLDLLISVIWIKYYDKDLKVIIRYINIIPKHFANKFRSFNLRFFSPAHYSLDKNFAEFLFGGLLYRFLFHLKSVLKIKKNYEYFFRKYTLTDMLTDRYGI